jgi:transcriptional regulator with XRE-family HTH domain
MTPSQLRAARALLDWSQDRLAGVSHVSAVTIRNYENGKVSPHQVTLDALRRALEEAGVAFIEENGGGAGVRWRRPG